MPASCDGKDVFSQVLAPASLERSAPEAPPQCDPDGCELEDAGHPKCHPLLCGHGGKMHPKRQCPSLWATPAAPAAITAAAAGGAPRKPKGDPEKLAAARVKAATRIRPKLEALVKELADARRARALDADEELLLDLLKRWGKALPRARRRARR